MKKRILFMSAVLALSGCEVMTADAMTGESEVNDTTKGLVAGCLTGGIVGALISKGKGAAIGCAAAGGAGALIGYNMDNQESELRNKLVGTGVQVERHGDSIKLIMPGDISFESGMTLLKPSIKPALDSIALIMNEYPSNSLIINGHTDSIGDFDYNERLSIIRAKAVEVYLRNQGVSQKRMISNGFGETQPICDNMYAPGRACNRRVVLDLVFE